MIWYCVQPFQVFCRVKLLCIMLNNIRLFSDFELLHSRSSVLHSVKEISRENIESATSDFKVFTHGLLALQLFPRAVSLLEGPRGFSKWPTYADGTNSRIKLFGFYLIVIQ